MVGLVVSRRTSEPSAFIVKISRLPARPLVKAMRAVTDLPLAVGFGISTPAHVKVIRRAGADAVIVGSAIIERMAKSSGKKMSKELDEFAKWMKKACRMP